MLDRILIIDFGSQYTQLIARRIRELSVFSEICPYTDIPSTITNVKGVIYSGSPASVQSANNPKIDSAQFRGLPVLGICYGAQLIAKMEGGTVESSKVREFGQAKISQINKKEDLMRGLNIKKQVWMSHGDTIVQLPKSFEVLASTDSVKIAAYKIKDKKTYGVQFHPEVTHSTEGQQLIKNFVLTICQCKQEWTPTHFVGSTVSKIKQKIGLDKVILGLSGGVDSSVVAMLLHKAIGPQLLCIFVDNGLLRKNEYKTVLLSYKGMGLSVKGIDAKEKFYKALAGIKDPEAKRKSIGKTFIDVFEEESKKIEGVKWLAQGTIYPDIIESISVGGGGSSTIKSHHNVGGLPSLMKLRVIEPLKTLFKDEVRKIGKALQISSDILERHPFPGPGLGIRILGDITPSKVVLLQEVDYIFIQGLKEANLYDQVWQAGAMLLPIQTVGVMGDERTYEQVVSLRAVSSVDGMTADWSHLPHKFLGEISTKIINTVKGVNRVVYDISSKPPATIEWE